MNELEVKWVHIPDGYIRISVMDIKDIPDTEEGDAIIYKDSKGVSYCFFEGGVYIYGDEE